MGFVFAFLSIIFCLDLFLHSGRPATFDGPTHLTTIAQFYESLHAGEFPVRWSNTYTMYGFPLAELSHQFTSYVGALFLMMFNQVETSYNLVVLACTFLGAVSIFRWLHLHSSPTSSLIGSIVFIFSAYRIINIYIRGSIPEYAAMMWIPSLMVGLHQWLLRQKPQGILEVMIATTLLLLTHPMIVVPGGILVGWYAVYLLLQLPIKKWFIMCLPIGISVVLGITVAAYYIVPLFGEMKYFYYGQEINHLRPTEFLSIDNYFNMEWYYFKPNTHPGPRGNFNKFGLIETGIVFTIIPYILFEVGRRRSMSLPLTMMGAAICLVVGTLSVSMPLYDRFSFMNGLQFPWRMFSALVMIPPLIVALWVDRMKTPKIAWMIVFLFIAIRIPQLYGKNYLTIPQTNYHSTQANLHTEILNTIWMGRTRDYKPKTIPSSIIAGKGNITPQKITNNSRSYEVSAMTPIRVVDYTFYFPGWKVFVDNVPASIEFQDPAYRGIITYNVPAGDHQIQINYSDTKVRQLGKMITILGTVCALIWSIFVVSSKLFVRR
jgi:hypothetical protein